jgi:hypothetical protein
LVSVVLGRGRARKDTLAKWVWAWSGTRSLIALQAGAAEAEATKAGCLQISMVRERHRHAVVVCNLSFLLHRSCQKLPRGGPIVIPVAWEI